MLCSWGRKNEFLMDCLVVINILSIRSIFSISHVSEKDCF